MFWSAWLYWPPFWSLITHQGLREHKALSALRFYCTLIALEGRQGQNTNLLCSCRPSHLSLERHNMTHAFANGHLLAPEKWLYTAAIARRFSEGRRHRFGSRPRNQFRSKSHSRWRWDAEASRVSCCVLQSWNGFANYFQTLFWQVGLRGMLFFSSKEFVCTFRTIFIVTLQKLGWLSYFIALQTSPSDWKKGDC